MVSLPKRKGGGDMEITGGFFEYGIAALLGFMMMVGASNFPFR